MSQPWLYTLEVDAVSAKLDGRLIVRGVEVVAKSSNLRLGGAVALRAATERFAVLANLTYQPMAVSREVLTPWGVDRYSSDLHQLTLDLDYAARLSRAFEFVLGARLVSCNCENTYIGYGPGEGWYVREAKTKSWVDPVIGLQARVPLSNAVSLAARADAGGFGAASQTSWQVIAAVDVRMSPGLSLRLGFRSFSDEYERDPLSHEYFLYDLRSAGPLLGVVISL